MGRRAWVGTMALVASAGFCLSGFSLSLAACANGNDALTQGSGVEPEKEDATLSDVAADAAAADGSATDAPPGSQSDAAQDGGSTVPVDSGGSAVAEAAAMDAGHPVDSAVTMADSGTKAMDSSTVAVDSGTISPITDSGGPPDVVIPDVVVPTGTTVCNYLGSAGDFAQYVGECLIFGSGGAECATGCATSQCCGAICTPNGQPVCLPK